MAITVDTSAIMAVVSNERSKTAVLEHTQEQDLIAPASIKWEVGNALSALVKRKVISDNHAIAASDLFGKMTIRQLEINLPEAVNLATQYKIYAYDAYILYCALHYRTSVLSLDKALCKIATDLRIKVLEIK